MIFQEDETFVIPVTAGLFAPEVVYIGGSQVKSLGAFVLTLMLQVTTAGAAGNLLVAEVLRPGTAAATDANWVEYATLDASVVGKLNLPDMGGATVRVRGKSGGTAGNPVATICADIANQKALVAGTIVGPIAQT